MHDQSKPIGIWQELREDDHGLFVQGKLTSMEQIETALAERDAAIKEVVDDLEAKNLKLEEKNADMIDRLIALEQRDSGFIPEGKKQPEFSLQKVMRHLSNPRDNPLDGYEAEMHQELSAKSGISRPNAVMIPLSTKTVDYNTPNFNSPLESAGGSNLVETVLHRDLIDILREESVIMGLNPTVINTQGDLDIPKKTTGTTGYWFAADGSDSITESTPVFTALEMRPKFVAGLTKATYKMMLQTGNGNSAGIRVKPILGNSVLETVMIRGYGTWNGATVTLKVSDDAGSTWTGLTSETGAVTSVFTNDFTVIMRIPSGLWFRAEISGSGSPQSSLTVRATGDLEAA